MTKKNSKMIVVSSEVDNMILKLGLMRDSYSNVIKKLIIYYNSNGKENVELKRDST